MRKRVAALCMAVCLLLSLNCFTQVSYANTTKTSAEALNWVRSLEGKKVGSGQCVALIASYYNYLGFSASSGNACDYATNAIPAGSGWTREKGGVPKPGDILIYTGGYGHVAIFESTNVAWHQNWGGFYVQKVSRDYRTEFFCEKEGVTKYYWGCIHVAFKDSGGDYVDLGESFCGNIMQQSAWVPIINNNGNVEIGPSLGNINEYWWFERQSDGSYIIESLYDNKFLDVSGALSKDGTNVKTHADTGSDAQKWYIKNGKFGYMLVPKHAKSSCLDCANGSLSVGTNMRLWEQNNTKAQGFSIYKQGDWKINNFGQAFNANIMQQSAWVPIINNNGNVEVGPSLGNINEYWWFERQNDGSYIIESLYDNKFLDVSGALSKNGTNIKTHADTGSDAQKWYIKSKGNYGYILVPKHAQSSCLDCAGGSLSVGTNMQLWEQNGTDAQKYSIYKQGEQKLCNVVFNSNQGNLQIKNKIVTYNSTYGDLPTPTRTGYSFTGWFTAASGGTQVTKDTKVTITANQTLYAQWKANSYTVKYNANGGTGATADSVHSYDSEKALTKNGFTKKYYTFTGWNTKPDGSGSSYADGAKIKNLTAENGKVITLYAQWKRTVSTKTTLESHGDYTLCSVKINGAAAPCRVIFAAYKSGRLVSAETRPYASGGETFMVAKDFDTVRVMVWNGLNGMEPISEVETVKK